MCYITGWIISLMLTVYFDGVISRNTRRCDSKNHIILRTQKFELPVNQFQIKRQGNIQGGRGFLREPLLNDVIVASPRRRKLGRSRLNVDPTEVDCQSSAFKDGLKQLTKKIRCTPRDVIVEITAPNYAIVSPNAVITKRCGGACNGATSCIATRTRNITLHVTLVTDYDTSCTAIQVPEDQACKCRCSQKTSDCLQIQKFDKAACKCKCLNGAEQLRCYRSKNFEWDEQQCACVCAEEKSCTTGTVWVPKECRCAKLLD